jgi:hypothetical protein
MKSVVVVPTAPGTIIFPPIVKPPISSALPALPGGATSHATTASLTTRCPTPVPMEGDASMPMGITSHASGQPGSSRSSIVE